MGTLEQVSSAPAKPASAEGELEELFRQHQEHNNAFFNGRTEAEHWVHDDDVTLHGGFDISLRGWSDVAPGLEWAANRLSEGEVVFTPLGGRIVGDLAYLAGVEEGTARLDGGERRPMRLRVTMVLQRVEGRWLCVHRHGEMTPPAGARPAGGRPGGGV